MYGYCNSQSLTERKKLAQYEHFTILKRHTSSPNKKYS